MLSYGVTRQVKRGIGELLVDNGQISPEQLQKAQEEKNQTGELLSTVILRLGLVDENQIKNILELEYGVSSVPLRRIFPDMKTVQLVPERLVRQYEAIPLSRESNRVTLVMVNPSDGDALTIFKSCLPNLQIKTVVASEDDFWDFVGRAYPQGNIRLEGKEFRADPNVENTEWDQADDAAVILLSNHIVSNAIAKGCSNIHIEPTDSQILVHYRKDGVLFPARKLPKTLLAALVSRYKKMSGLSTNENGLPQDGRLNLWVDGAQKDIAFRLSIVAGLYGEHLIIWLE